MADIIPNHIQGWRLLRTKANVTDDDDWIEEGSMPDHFVGVGPRWEERDETVREVELMAVFELAGVPVFGTSRGVLTAEIGVLVQRVDVAGSPKVPVSVVALSASTGMAIQRAAVRGPAEFFVQLSSITVPTGSGATTMKVYWRPA